MELTLILGISVLGLLFALYLIRDVLRATRAPRRCGRSPTPSRRAPRHFCARQNRTIIYLAFALACLIYILYAFVRTHNEHDPADPVPARDVDHPLVRLRRALFRGRRLHGDVGGDPLQHPHGGGRHRRT